MKLDDVNSRPTHNAMIGPIQGPISQAPPPQSCDVSKNGNAALCKKASKSLKKTTKNENDKKNCNCLVISVT